MTTLKRLAQLIDAHKRTSQPATGDRTMAPIDQFKKSQHDGSADFAALVAKRIAETGESAHAARLAVVKTAEGRAAYAASGGYSARSERAQGRRAGAAGRGPRVGAGQV